MNFARRKLSAELQGNVSFVQADISKPLNFPDHSFDVVYSHLAIHYFDRATTEKIIGELWRVLKPKGFLALLVNSANDPEYGAGEKIDDDYYVVNGVQKRFFSAESLGKLLGKFEAEVLDEKGETYKDRAVSTTNLTRFVGRKN